MAGWNRYKGRAVALNVENIDTDQLIPARFMSVPRGEGYGSYLLHDLRRDDDAQLDPDFPLNRCPDATILVTGRDFGIGSSREAAVYALVDDGFRAVISPSFGDIFASNAVNNGLLPAQLESDAIDTLLRALGDDSGDLSIDLERSTLSLGDFSTAFSLDESWRIKLLNGWDDIDLTKRHSDEIARYRTDRSQTAPWAWPAAVD